MSLKTTEKLTWTPPQHNCVRGGPSKLAVVARGMRAAGDQSSCPAWGRRGADSGCQSETLAGGPVA